VKQTSPVSQPFRHTPASGSAHGFSDEEAGGSVHCPWAHWTLPEGQAQPEVPQTGWAATSFPQLPTQHSGLAALSQDGADPSCPPSTAPEGGLPQEATSITTHKQTRRSSNMRGAGCQVFTRRAGGRPR
jgi:hypothetical protein